MMGQIFSGAVRAVFRKRKGFGFVKILHWLLLALFSAAAAFARLRLLAAGFDANGLPVPMNLNTMALPAVLIVAAVIVLVMARRYPAQRELCGGMDLYFAFDRSTLAVMLTVLGCFALIGSAVYSMVFSLRTTVTMALSVFLAVRRGRAAAQGGVPRRCAARARVRDGACADPLLSRACGRPRAAPL